MSAQITVMAFVFLFLLVGFYGGVDTGRSPASAGMESIASIDSQLVLLGHDSVLAQQRLQEIQDIELEEADMDTLQMAIMAQRILDVDTVISENNAIAAPLVFEANKKTVNGIFLNTIAKDTFGFDAAQKDALLHIAAQCPLTGGTAVYEARSLLALVQDINYDDDALCNGTGQRSSSGGEKAAHDNGFHLFPNPAAGQVTLTLPNSTASGKVVFVNAQGAIVLERNIAQKARSVNINTGQLGRGIYLVNVLDNNKKVFSDKLIIVH